jgi:phenylpropionate dioxygenase-like ring-hydroxylating dioxygenase large terminal subunit
MQRADDIAVAHAVARQRAGFALERFFYVDPDLFRREIKQLLMRHWLCAGHESRAARPGDHFLFELAAESVIIVRGEDGVLRAFANVCRHRGSRICAQASEGAKNFVCPYHAWTYGLDGRLLAARHMPAGFDAAQYGLKPIHLRVIEGVVFVTLNPAPLRLDKVEKTLKDCLGPYRWSAARVAHREIYAIAANWKLAVENYLECYHCSPSHPEYSRLHALEQPTQRIASLIAGMEQRAAALGIDIPQHDHRTPSKSGEETVYGFRYPLYDGVATGSEDGSPLAPLMGDFTDYDGAVTSIHLAPASFLIAYPDHGVIYRFIAKTPASCEMELVWLVRDGAREAVDYDLGRLTWLWKVTTEADKRIVEQNQLGVGSQFYEPGPYAPMEENTRRYVEWYLGEIA